MKIYLFIALMIYGCSANIKRSDGHRKLSKEEFAQIKPHYDSCTVGYVK